MRFLIFFNLIAIIVIGAALARMYQGTPLPWRWSYESTSTTKIAPSVSAPAHSLVIPEESAKAPPAAQALRFLTEGSYPPFNGRDGAGKLVGYDIDMANAICQHLQHPCDIETRPWKDLLPALRQREGDAVIASMLIGSPAINDKAQIVFSNPYYTTPGHFAARRGGGNLAALTKNTIVVQAGSTHEAFLKAHFPAARRLAVKTLDEAEQALAERRADLLFADRNALLIWLESKEAGTCCQLVGGDYTDPEYFGAGAGIAVRAGDKTLLAEINKALAEMARDGTESKIARPYFGRSIR